MFFIQIIQIFLKLTKYRPKLFRFFIRKQQIFHDRQLSLVEHDILFQIVNAFCKSK